jgi:hypothetical protein
MTVAGTRVARRVAQRLEPHQHQLPSLLAQCAKQGLSLLHGIPTVGYFTDGTEGCVAKLQKISLRAHAAMSHGLRGVGILALEV